MAVRTFPPSRIRRNGAEGEAKLERIEYTFKLTDRTVRKRQAHKRGDHKTGDKKDATKETPQAEPEVTEYVPFEDGQIVARWVETEKEVDGSVVIKEQSRMRLFRDIPVTKRQHIVTCGVIDQIATLPGDPNEDRDEEQFAWILIAGEVLTTTVDPEDLQAAAEYMPKVKFVRG